MTSLDQLKHTFFDECAEALQQIESGLTELREGVGSDETIHAVFRSVHSVKGGAGIFGFEHLVGFAHAFETVLDAMRSGKMAAAPDIIDLLLSANDVLTDLIAMSRNDDAIPPGFGSECRAALERLMGQDGSGGHQAAEEPAPADFEGLDFMPVRAEDFDSASEANGVKVFDFVFRPKPDLSKAGNDPLLVVRELRKLGELALTPDLAGLPPLAEVEPQRAYLGWAGTLKTAADRSQIERIFGLVADDCEFTLAADGAAPFEPAAEAALGPSASHPEPQFEPTVLVVSPPLSPSNAGSPPPPGFASPEPEPATQRAASAKAGATTTRVELEKIDRVVNLVGELVIAQAMLGQVVHGLPEETSGRLLQVLEEVSHHTRELKDSVMSMRAQPIGAVFQRMPRLVRELASKTGKKVHLEMHGEKTEVDRSIIERLSDPLTHIIRNSIDHGIEPPEVRVAAGKREEGTIRLNADHRGGRIVVEVTDDGGGIDAGRVLAKARERGLVAADAVLNEDEINNLIFAPGFSTADKVSDISGRGVGMDVVRRNIQDIGGRITLKSERSRGMTIQLALPLTLAVMDGMVIKVGGQTYVIPMSAIVECLRPPTADVHALMGAGGVLKIRGALVPLTQLCDLLDIGESQSTSEERVVIVADGGDGSRFGIVVDELCGHQQVVVKSMEESYGSLPGVAGATILGNGRVALILDVEKLSELALIGNAAAAPPSSSGRAGNRQYGDRQYALSAFERESVRSGNNA